MHSHPPYPYTVPILPLLTSEADNLPLVFGRCKSGTAAGDRRARLNEARLTSKRLKAQRSKGSTGFGVPTRPRPGPTTPMQQYMRSGNILHKETPHHPTNPFTIQSFVASLCSFWSFSICYSSPNVHPAAVLSSPSTTGVRLPPLITSAAVVWASSACSAASGESWCCDGRKEQTVFQDSTKPARASLVG